MRREPEPIEQFAGARLGKLRLDAPQAGDEFKIFIRRELVVGHRLVGNPRGQPLGRERIGERIDAGDADRARIRTQEPGDHAQGRGLAGAVRAEQRVELAGAHGEIEAIDRRAVEAFEQATDFERKRRRCVLHAKRLTRVSQPLRM
jgi:hypothetical protein